MPLHKTFRTFYTGYILIINESGGVSNTKKQGNVMASVAVSPIHNKFQYPVNDLPLLFTTRKHSFLPQQGQTKNYCSFLLIYRGNK